MSGRESGRSRKSGKIGEGGESGDSWKSGKNVKSGKSGESWEASESGESWKKRRVRWLGSESGKGTFEGFGVTTFSWHAFYTNTVRFVSGGCNFVLQPFIGPYCPMINKAKTMKNLTGLRRPEATGEKKARRLWYNLSRSPKSPLSFLTEALATGI